MDNPEAKDLSQCVKVAVNIRPLVTSELLVGSTDCITVLSGEPQVQIGSHAFTFDYVFGSNGSPSSCIFDQCVAPIVDSLFNGYNGTVLAYGQTGSGKTYTMGTNYNGEEHISGVLPKAMETIFSKLEEKKSNTEFLIRVSYIEIFKEEVFDLLDRNPHLASRVDGVKTNAPSRTPIQIRETVSGGITLAGVTEAEVRTKEEMESYLLLGSAARTTGSTNMNSQSSRSHSIFTISLDQKKNASSYPEEVQDEDNFCAKLHLVDLAGSERAKRTGADGMRFQEGIHINKGLLALGNVISALGDEKKRKDGGHVPYRDSKLTRLLQDSLGGNSKTVMIACVSPADTNAEETLNTLKYANRARNIQNKAIINRDPMASQMQKMRSQIEQLQAELLFFQGDSGTSFEELQIIKQRVSCLETSKAELQRQLKECRIACEHYSHRALEAQVEKDELIMKIESARNGKTWDEIDINQDQDLDLLKTHVGKIQELEREVLRLKNTVQSNELRHHKSDSFEFDNYEIDSRDSSFLDISEYSSGSYLKNLAIEGEADYEEKQKEHSFLQQKLDKELKDLDQKLEQKEVEMEQFNDLDTSDLTQHYEKKVHELEHEKRVLQKEIQQLKHYLENISSNSDESAQKLKEDYLKKLNVLESQVVELKKKQVSQAQLLSQKQKSDEAARRLQDEIQRIKSHKVQLQQRIKQESEQFRQWKASREKEVLQLKKEGRRNEYEMHKLLALNQRQKMVLERKTQEAAMASKRLKELLESRKSSSRETSGHASGYGPGIQGLMQTIEHELEVVVRMHEVRSEYDRQMEARAKMAKEMAELKEEAHDIKQENLSAFPETMSPGAKKSRVFALEYMLATSSSALVAMASQLSEAEEREHSFSGRGRWNQVRSLVEAKNIMNHLFNLTTSYRCQLRDKEVDCRERDSEIKDLKEKVVNLARQLEMQKLAFIRQEKLQGARASFNWGNTTAEQKEDMDICESEDSDRNDMADEDSECEQDKSAKQQQVRKQNSKSNNCPSTTVSCQNYISDSENPKSETPPSEEEGATNGVANISVICCTCIKGSLFKTSKCQCQANGKNCQISCICAVKKFSNRDVQLEILDSDEKEKNKNPFSHDAKLLQSALLTNKVDEMDQENGLRRKPLSSIRNKVKSNDTKLPNQRKKWTKSIIQLAPVAPPSQQSVEGSAEEISFAKEESSNTTKEAASYSIPSWATRYPTSNFNLLRDGNSEKKQHSLSVVAIMESSCPPLIPRSPHKQQKVVEEKENHHGL
ncbi:kinesin-like protein KIN-4C [Impatiens glandulifera]|uniref:kinesin-like protein KIN-4C n=1 Tax=Impatiens glandulifera TaxID=253017 RepID=UPI001FB17D4C|nr:kinesin-like protein KIN-4C [Impatiens glandulifera]